MKITEQTTTRLVIQHQRRTMAWVLALFTLLSFIFLLMTLYNGIRAIENFRGWQWFGWVTWVIFALVLVVIGVRMLTKTGTGITLIFDRNTEQLTLQHRRFINTHEQHYSIYAVSQIDVEGNDEFRVYGVFLVLRSGERIALATVPVYDEADVRQISKQVRAFLRQNA